MKMTIIQARAAISALTGAFPLLDVDIAEPTGICPDTFVGISITRRNITKVAYDMFEAGDYAQRMAGVK